MKNKIFNYALIISIFFIFGCSTTNSHKELSPKKENHFILVKKSSWQIKLSRLKKDKKAKFRIIQLGDSHTAADIFSQTVRTTLKKHFGDGGIGLISPVNIAGQRNATVKQQSKNWQVFKNKSNNGEKVPLGGVLAVAKKNSLTEIIPLSPTTLSQQVNIHFKSSSLEHTLLLIDAKQRLYKIKPQQKQWQNKDLQVFLPLKLEVQNGNIELGQINIENKQGGVIYSSLGVNGARLSALKYWREDWLSQLKKLNPDLLILAFGTNETIDPHFNPQREKHLWQKHISQIKQHLPNMGIILIGVPDLNQGNKQCKPLVNHQSVLKMQQEIASEFQLILWDWQDIMGGKCAMFDYQKQGLGQKDGIHLTPKGYIKTGKIFANFLISLVENKE